jgi:hypothetical protein
VRVKIVIRDDVKRAWCVRVRVAVIIIAIVYAKATVIVARIRPVWIVGTMKACASLLQAMLKWASLVAIAIFVLKV